MIKYIDKLIKKLKSSQKGQGMVEYALIIAFVAAIAIVALNNGLGDAIKGAFNQASSAVTSATNAAGSYANQSSASSNPSPPSEGQTT